MDIIVPVRSIYMHGITVSMRPDIPSGLWRYINHVLTYLLTCSFARSMGLLNKLNA